MGIQLSNGLNMKVLNVENKQIAFGRALSTREAGVFSVVADIAQKKLGNDGKSLLIVHDACLPQDGPNNTGVGNVSSVESGLFFDLMKKYLNINMVEVLPQGEPRLLGGRNKFYCAYGAPAYSLGSHVVNLNLLMTPEFGQILTEKEFQSVVRLNTRPDKADVVNYENVVGMESEQNLALRKAFKRFLASENVDGLKKRLEDYKQENADWLVPKVFFNALTKEYKNNNWRSWSELDKNLMEMNPQSRDVIERKADLHFKYSEDMEFFQFQQFIADEHLKIGKDNLNKKGLKLVGDCLIGFSQDEVWANKSAFAEGCSIGWELPALNYDEICNENSAAAKALKRKVELFAKRYDSIRFDVSWAYITPIVTPDGVTKVDDKYKKPMGNKVLELIEKTVKSVKGEDFNPRDLFHEFEASPEDFKLFEKGKLIEPVQNRTKVVGTTYMKQNWGSNDAYLKRGFDADTFIAGVGNHDPQPLYEIAYDIPDNDGTIRKPAQIEPLAEILKLDANILEKNPVEFIKAKFAEPFMAKHHYFFYMDVFARKERFDSQEKNSELNYRHKIPENFEVTYHKAVQSGKGLNLMDALAKAFHAKGLDKSESALYRLITKYRDILYEKGVCTEAEANKLGL